MNAGATSIQDKIDQLNKEAWEIRVSDSNKAQVLSQEAIDLATSARYKKGLAEGLRTLGFSYIRLSKYSDAKKSLDDALLLFEELDNKCGQSDVYEYLGIIQRSFGDYKGSLDSIYKALELRQENNYRDGESLSLYHLGVTYKYLGNLEQALECFLKSLIIAREINYWVSESYSLNNIGGIYLEFGDYDNALKYYYESLVIRRKTGDKWGEAGCLDNIGYINFKNGNYNEANSYYKSSMAIAYEVGDKKGEGNCLFHLAEINNQTGSYSEAQTYATKSLLIRREIGDKKGQAELYLFLASLEGTQDQKLKLLKQALELGMETKALDLLYKIHEGFYQSLKEQKQYEEALTHLELFHNTEKEIHSNATNQKILNLEINHRVEQSRKETEIYRLRNIELARLYEKSNQQKQEIEMQKTSLEKTLSELRATQAQLIQSEKMASLGELTAGIAHEIQNPLNFVNNFSEVNTELIDEMQQEIKKGHYEEINSITNDIRENEQKINHHGKRAEAIVRGMLQHSRSNAGEKELTDINALADEYLRLSYHGFRTKNKSLSSGQPGFNATIKTDYDEKLDKVNVIPQDLGRVFLNLFNNAFYSISEKNKLAVKSTGNGESYEPMISVATSSVPSLTPGSKGVEIRVKDNGIGIPPELIDKIYQPFFTTKPSGEGTGLGLSLSYDLISKEHGGSIQVNTEPGEYAEFIIFLPV